MFDFKKQRLFFILSLILFACNSKKILPEYTGKAGEIILVIENGISKKYTKSLKNILEREIDFLAQSEKQFNVFTVSENNFKGVYKKYRNVIFLKKSDKNNINLTENIWAKNQLVYTFSVNQNFDYLNTIKSNLTKISATINKKEISRLQTNYKTNSAINNTLKKYNIQLKIPQQYFIAKNNDSLFWLRKETKETSLGIIGYHNSFERDSVLKYNIPGPSKGSYMKTKVFSKYKNTEVVRGIWELENDFMGGPFVERKIKTKSKILNVLGYVYAPNKNKRELLREVEAIITTINVN